MLTPKKDGFQSICINSRGCRAIVNIIVRYRFPEPICDDIFNQIAGSKWFPKIDLGRIPPIENKTMGNWL